MKTEENIDLRAETPERLRVATPPAETDLTDTHTDGVPCVARRVAADARRRRGRRPRALSSPARSVRAASGPASRPRSPSVRAPRSPPLPPPLPPPPAYPGDVVVVPGSGEGPRGLAYFSPRPPPAPLWLAVCPAPLPAPCPAHCAAALDTRPTSPRRQKLNLELFEGSETASADARAARRCAMRAVPQRYAPDESPTRPVSPRASPRASQPASPRSVAVQTPRKAISRDERDSCSVVSNDKTSEWAGGARALRDGHVRLALRALRQLRRAERLHRALLRAPADTIQH